MTYKLPPLVISKSAKIRGFKRVNMANIQAHYRNKSKAWMTGAIFREWLIKLANPKTARLIYLLIIFLVTIELNFVEVILFPTNCSSKLQPLDQGIRANFKLKNFKSLF